LPRSATPQAGILIIFGVSTSVATQESIPTKRPPRSGILPHLRTKSQQHLSTSLAFLLINMTTENIRKRIRKKAGALTDSLRRHGRLSPSPSVSPTVAPGSSKSATRDMVTHVSPVNQSSHQPSVPTPTIRVSPEQQLSSATASPSAVSLTEENRPLTGVRALHDAI